MPESTHRQAAFSLVELLVVVVVLGILAAIVTPKFANAQKDARVAATAEIIKQVITQTESYYSKVGKWPRDVGPTQSPAEITSMFKVGNPFLEETPIGGVWDWENWSNGADIRLSIRGGWKGSSTPKLEYLKELDAYLDDGDLAKGSFRGGTSHAYFHISKP